MGVCNLTDGIDAKILEYEKILKVTKHSVSRKKLKGKIKRFKDLLGVDY